MLSRHFGLLGPQRVLIAMTVEVFNSTQTIDTQALKVGCGGWI